MITFGGSPMTVSRILIAGLNKRSPFYFTQDSSQVSISMVFLKEKRNSGGGMDARKSILNFIKNMR
jgi:hypothetical protein